MYFVTGANLFGQWLLEDKQITEFRYITTACNNKLKFELNKAELVCISWSYNIFKETNDFYIIGSWAGKDNQVIKFVLPQDFANLVKTRNKAVLVGNDYNLILTDGDLPTLWILNLETGNIKKIDLKIEEAACTPPKVGRRSGVRKIALSNTSWLYLTGDGTVYQGLLPTIVDTTHCIGSVCDIQCGYEHYVLLTDIGRVYTWGNGRRLQLGHGDLINLDIPTEVEALSGIKIIKISAGGWHTLALSEFGDVYAWGWNDTGQLGTIDIEKKESINSYHVPTVVDLYNENLEEIKYNVKDIACGSRHTAILLEDNSVWTTGNNKYGQLGFPPESLDKLNYFKKSFQCSHDSFITCGYWSTVIKYRYP